jgi:hypothetical protein
VGAEQLAEAAARNGLTIMSELVGASDGSSTSGRAAVPRSSLRSALARRQRVAVTCAPVASRRTRGCG